MCVLFTEIFTPPKRFWKICKGWISLMCSLSSWASSRYLRSPNPLTRSPHPSCLGRFAAASRGAPPDKLSIESSDARAGGKAGERSRMQMPPSALEPKWLLSRPRSAPAESPLVRVRGQAAFVAAGLAPRRPRAALYVLRRRASQSSRSHLELGLEDVDRWLPHHVQSVAIFRSEYI